MRALLMTLAFLAATSPAFAGSLPDPLPKAVFHAHQVVVTGSISGDVMTVIKAPGGDKRQRIVGSMTVSGPGIADAPVIVAPLGQAKYRLSKAESVPTATLTLTLRSADETGAVNYLLGRCAYAAAAATRDDGGTQAAATQERLALKSECASRKEPADWAEKASLHARAVALHATAARLNPNLPLLESR